MLKMQAIDVGMITVNCHNLSTITHNLKLTNFILTANIMNRLDNSISGSLCQN